MKEKVSRNKAKNIDEKTFTFKTKKALMNFFCIIKKIFIRKSKEIKKYRKLF